MSDDFLLLQSALRGLEKHTILLPTGADYAAVGGRGKALANHEVVLVSDVEAVIKKVRGACAEWDKR